MICGVVNFTLPIFMCGGKFCIIVCFLCSIVVDFLHYCTLPIARCIEWVGAKMHCKKFTKF